MMNKFISVRDAMALQEAHKPLDPGDKIAWEKVEIGEKEEAEFFKTYAANIPNIKVRIIPDGMDSTVLDRILWNLPKNVEYLDCRGIPTEFHSLKIQLPTLKILLTDSGDLTDDPTQDQGSGLGTERLPPTLIELYANCPDLRFTNTKEALPLLKILDADASMISDLRELPTTLEELSVNNCNLIAVDISTALPNLRVFIAINTEINLDDDNPMVINYKMFPASIERMVLDNSNIHIFNNIESRYRFENLKVLSFIRNQIESIEFLPPSLEELTISQGEKIGANFPTNIGSILPKLKKLRMADINLPDGAYRFPNALEDFSIGGNDRILDYKWLSFMTKLKHLDVSGTGVPGVEMLPPSLIHLNVNSAGPILIDDMGNFEFTGAKLRLPKLRRLLARSTTLSNVCELPESLTDLDATGCENLTLTSADICLPNLKTLNASGTGISSLSVLPPSLVFLGLKDNNKLSALDGIDKLVHLKNSQDVISIIDKNAL
jgi:hypothetical protein